MYVRAGTRVKPARGQVAVPAVPAGEEILFH